MLEESMVRSMRTAVTFSVLGLALWLGACGGSQEPAAAPKGEAPLDAEAPPAPAATAEPSADEPKPEPKAEKPAAPEPQFTDGMSVEEAVKAVPVGAERANIDQETLSTPIQDFAVYEPCKPGSERVKMKIAVWDGKAVGLDVTATPKNDKLVACIKDRLKGLTWKAHVKSLNTVEYSF
jgi:hypothetical protein